MRLFDSFTEAAILCFTYKIATSGWSFCRSLRDPEKQGRLCSDLVSSATVAGNADTVVDSIMQLKQLRRKY